MARHTTANMALQTLFELLEGYAPQWYTQEHHDIAADALANAKKRRSPSSVRHGLKGCRLNGTTRCGLFRTSGVKTRSSFRVGLPKSQSA
jgi:hypothetical protein